MGKIKVEGGGGINIKLKKYSSENIECHILIVD